MERAMSGTWYAPDGTPRSPNAPTAGDDSYAGSDGADFELDESGGPTPFIVGGEGNDTLDGRGGDDVLAGSEGDDLLIGGEGNDLLVGSLGDDTLLGGPGDDLLIPGPGRDSVIGGEGDDTIELGGDASGYRWQPVAGGWLVTDTDPSDGEDGTVFVGDDVEWVSYGVSGEVVQAPCFAAGTRIMTARGEVPVEALRAGDLVVTLGLNGAWLRPVRWVGRRAVDCTRHPRPRSVRPVVILPGALGPGVPHRVLRVSPDHALYLDGRLVPAGRLVDGEAILQPAGTRRVVYHHVELDAHDVILAEGAPAESWLDCGNRAQFDNGGALVALHPDFAAEPAGRACAPMAAEGAETARLRRLVASRRRPGIGAARG
jgi:hypothetical protein